MTVKRRKCSKCGKNRGEQAWKTPRQRVCNYCQKTRTQTASRDVRLWETYELTLEEYQRLLEAQGGACAICGGKRAYNLDVDHDHALERAVGTRLSIRGLLCKQCNRRILRAVRDSVEILEAAIRYLKDPPAQQVLAASSEPTMNA